MQKINKIALVVLSGGQDSVTCLGYALARFATVQAISFQYGQKHEVELQCAALLCEKYNVQHKLVDMGNLLSSLVSSALLGTGVAKIGDSHDYKKDLPASFVPGRNALFLVLAHAHAQEIGADTLITGVCQTDSSGYPDCRDGFVRCLQDALNIGYMTDRNPITILTPLMFLTKAQTFGLAEEVGFLAEVIVNSHTCYNGDHTAEHDWGFGCGTCPACLLRAKGWEEFQAAKAQEVADRQAALVQSKQPGE